MEEHVAIGKRAALVWLLINAIGVTAFLDLASRTWIEPELALVPGASGGAPIIWALTALPILLLFGMAHVGVCIWAVARRFRTATWPLPAVALASIPLWVIAAVLDGTRHGT